MEKQSEESLQLEEESVQSPWLLYHTFGKKEQVLCGASRRHHKYRYRIPILWNKSIWNCSYGWLLLRSNASRYMLLNPDTRQIMSLPVLPSKAGQVMSEGILWLPPDDPKSRVLLFDESRETITYCYVQQKQWIEVSYKRQAEKILGETKGRFMFDQLVTCNGRLYALSSTLMLVEIDISERTTLQIKSLECEVPSTDSHSARRSWWLAESQGDLFMINIVHGGVDYAETIDIGVFKLDLNSSEKQWREVKGSEIKDRAFFVGLDQQPVSCRTAGQEFEGGCIYFVAAKSQSLHSFDVEDGSLTMSLPPRSFSSAVWVMMSHLREETEETKKKKRSVKSFSDTLDSNGGSLVHEQTHSLLPSLMFSKSDRSTHHFIDPKSGNMFTIDADESLAGAKIRYSKDGWVLMTNIGKNSFFFYNPFTKKTFQLPEAPEAAANWDSFCFSGIPSSPECIVIGVDFSGFQCFDTSKQEWSFIFCQDFDEFPDDLSIHNTPVFFEGSFFFLGTEGSLSKLILEDRDLTVYNSLRCPSEDFCQNFLLEWDGKLASVFINNKWTLLQVFTLNEEKMAWEEVSSLGKYSLFLSRFSAFSVATNVAEMENKVYLSKIYEGDNVFFYCLKTKRYGCNTSKKRTKSFRGTKEYLSSCWIEPSWT